MELAVKAGSDMDEVELKVVDLLDQVITDCRLDLFKVVTDNLLQPVLIDIVWMFFFFILYIK